MRSIFYQVSGPVGRIGALREASGFCIMNPGPAGWIRARTRIRAPQDRSGPRGTDQGPAGRIRVPQDVCTGARVRGMDQGPAIRIRAPRDGSGLRTSNQGPQDESGPAGRIRAPQDVPGPLKTNQGPAGRIRAPCDEPGLSRTKRGPPHRIYFL